MCPDNEKASWLENLAEGGLPQLLAGPAGKAISRLVGSAVEVPAAYIDAFTESIKDRTKAKSKLTQAMGEKAAEMAVADPDLMDRAMNSFLGRQFRAQTNKEEIARIVVEELKSDPPSQDSEGPSEDWLNKFERYAEDASSEDLRLMFAKLLAGEIRSAGSISAATLHFVSMLDPEASKLIERVLPHCSLAAVCYMDAITPPLSHYEVTRLEQSGFWSAAKTLPVTYGDDGRTIIPVRDSLGIFSQATPNHSVRLNISVLSKVGDDLANTINRDFAIKAFAEILFKNGSTKCLAGKPVADSSGRMRLQNAFEIPPPKVPTP
ncbi:MAG: DUF2806 domain-containing protein [Rhodobacteraceae bacterium]|nr:DUF2806 domain-containing protein [Paracoccaceae bacterium]